MNKWNLPSLFFRCELDVREMACIDEGIAEYFDEVDTTNRGTIRDTIEECLEGRQGRQVIYLNPYREPEEPALASSALGILALKKSLDDTVCLIHNIRTFTSDVGFYLAVSGSFALLGSLTGLEGFVLGELIFFNYLEKKPKPTGSATSHLTEFLINLFKENLPVYQKTLREMLLRSDIQHENLGYIPHDYAQALLLDYACSQYSNWKEERVVGIEGCLPRSLFSKSKRTRLDEVTTALNRMDEKHFGLFINSFSADLSAGSVLDSNCYDCLHYLRSSTYLERRVKQINTAVAGWLDNLLKSGSEEDLFLSAGHFADFGYWNGFYRLLEKFLESSEHSPEDVALSIRKRNRTKFDTSNYETYQTALSVLFDFLADHDLFKRAEEILPLMSSRNQARYQLELKFVKYKKNA
jgi:hypothetical protein